MIGQPFRLRTDSKDPILHLSVCLFAVCTEGNGFLVNASFNVQDESFEICGGRGFFIGRIKTKYDNS